MKRILEPSRSRLRGAALSKRSLAINSWGSYPPHIATERAEKIRRATERDPVVIDRLQRLNLRVLVIWECGVRGDGTFTEAALREECEDFITGSEAFREIVGRNAAEIN
jgi:hypothetical protein